MGLLSILGVVETIKLGFLLYKLTVPGYGSGQLPYQVYLIFVFFIPDLLPTVIFTTLEFVSRRRAIIKELRIIDGRLTKFTRSTNSTVSRYRSTQSSSNSNTQGFEELGEPFIEDDMTDFQL